MREFDVVNLLIALSGVALGLTSLLVQHRQFAASGSVVEVFLRGVVVGDREPPTHGISVTARNKGRQGVSVTGWGVDLPNKHRYVLYQPRAGNSPLPHRIEPGDEASWWLPLDVLRKGLAEQGLGECKVSMSVDLGTGKTLVTPETFSIGPWAPE